MSGGLLPTFDPRSPNADRTPSWLPLTQPPPPPRRRRDAEGPEPSLLDAKLRSLQEDRRDKFDDLPIAGAAAAGASTRLEEGRRRAEPVANTTSQGRAPGSEDRTFGAARHRLGAMQERSSGKPGVVQGNVEDGAMMTGERVGRSSDDDDAGGFSTGAPGAEEGGRRIAAAEQDRGNDDGWTIREDQGESTRESGENSGRDSEGDTDDGLMFHMEP